MFDSPTTALEAAAEAVVVAGVFLTLGYLISDALAGARPLDAVERWGLALPGTALVTLVLMLAHMASRGGLFSRPVLTRGLTLGIAAVLVVLKVLRRGVRPAVEPPAAVAAACLTLVGAVVWGWPLVEALPLPNNADTRLWMGWAGELLNGEPVPTAPITGDIPNYYPWLYHAMVAFMALFTPGGRAYHALGPLQLLLVAGGTLSLFAFGRALVERWVGGAFAALFGALMGGFGFLVADGPAVVVDPRRAHGRAGAELLGDLFFKRSYSFPFQNLAPPFPRDLAFALLSALLLLLVLGAKHRNLAAFAWAGVVLGLTGLAGAEAFFVGTGAAAIVVLLSGDVGRLRAGAAVLLPMLAVYGLWLVPLGLSYLRLGGFVNITAVGPVTLPPEAILGSWGVATPLAVYGLARAFLGARPPGLRVAVAVAVAATAFLLVASTLPRVLGDAFTTLGRHHRYWPLLHLGVCIAGALGAADLADRVPRLLSTLAAAAVCVLALASPVLASLAVADEVPSPPLLEASLRGDDRTFLNVLSPIPYGRACNAAVGQRQDMLVFSYTGYRLVSFVWRPDIPNQARVRWAKIYDYLPGDAARKAANDVLVTGKGKQARWKRLAARYGVDVVMVPYERIASPVFAGSDAQVARGNDGSRFVIFRLRACT
jgi:hypothetical protein